MPPMPFAKIMVNFNWQAVSVISVTLVWSVLFLVFGSDSPATNNWAHWSTPTGGILVQWSAEVSIVIN